MLQVSKKSSRLSSDDVSKMSSGFFLDENEENFQDKQCKTKSKASNKTFNDSAESEKLNKMYRKKVQIGETFTQKFQAKIDNGQISSQIKSTVDGKLKEEFVKKGFTSEGNRLFKVSENKKAVATVDSDDTISSCRLSEESEERAQLAAFEK